MSQIENLSRRSFLKSIGLTSGGLVIGGMVPFSNPVFAGSDGLASLNLFVHISPDNQVHIICHRSEMGQGIRTGLPQVVADELQADWAKVQVVQGLANAEYGSQNTDGSRSIRNFYLTMREMGAVARTLLEQAGAARWGVPVTEVKAENHEILHAKSGRALSFGELAQDAAKLPAPDKSTLVLKSSKDFKYIGKPLPIVDMDDILQGTTVFGQDVQLPNMLYASIARWPVLGAKLTATNDKASRQVKGVQDVITLPDLGLPVMFKAQPGVAVLANNSWAALKGREKLELTWDHGPHASHNTDSYLEKMLADVKTKGTVNSAKGDAYSKIEAASDTLEASYSVPYQGHLPMEPVAATAHFHDGICEIWACVQTPQSTQQTVAGLLGLKPENVKVNVTLLGGAFGRKSKPDFAVEAAYLAKKAGRPVKVFWTREDDIKHDYYHAISAQHYQASLDQKGEVSAWLQRTAFPTISSTFNAAANSPSDGELSLGFADLPFALDHLSCESHAAESHVRIGWVRSVSNIHHAFGIGSFVDELAVKTGTRNTDMWRKLLGKGGRVDPSATGFKYGNYDAPLDQYPIEIKRYLHLIDVLEKSTDMHKALPKGQGWGFSIHRSFVSYVAVATKVEVKDGAVKVLDMHTAIDCGLAVNPDRVKAQMEGSMVFGLSIALMGGITVKDGMVEQSNFHDAQVARMHQSPPITVHIVQGKDELPGGVGEPGLPPVMASVTNAIFAASGQRIRDLPVSKVLRV